MSIVSQPANNNYRDHYDETFKKGKPQEFVLKPCPWCGKRPGVQNDPLRIGVKGDHHDEYYIACDNHECSLQPAIRGCATLAHVIAVWNNRKA